jgi:hypothetical protein
MDRINNNLAQLEAHLAALELAANNNGQAGQAGQAGYITPPNQGVQRNPNILNAPNQPARVVARFGNNVNDNPANVGVQLLALRSRQIASFLNNMDNDHNINNAGK